MAKTILGIFSEGKRAEDLIHTLKDHGFNAKDISIVMKDTQEAKDIGKNTGADVAEGTVTGATTGGVIGALAGLLVGTGVIPGLGALLIGGPLAAALGLTGAAATTVSGAATGALAGGLIGALTSAFGLTEDEAKEYEESIKEGGILVAVPTKDADASMVKGTMHEFGADKIREVTAETERHSHGYADQDSSTARPAYFSEVKKERTPTEDEEK